MEGLTRRSFLARGSRGLGALVLGGGVADVLAACSPAANASASQRSGRDAALLASGDPISLDVLRARAQSEGGLNLTGISPAWAGYDQILLAYKRRYGLTPDFLRQSMYTPDQQIDAMVETRTGRGFVPDVADLAQKFDMTAVDAGVAAPYRTSHWDEIPETLKDTDGRWTGEYFGVMAFAVNTRRVSDPPRDWSDLMRPELRGLVTTDGDPQYGTDALMAVWSAALANGGSAGNLRPGVEFFARLKRLGNYAEGQYSAEHLRTGRIAVALTWDYLALALRDRYAGTTPIEVIIPRSASVGAFFAAMVNRYATHPFAARLWIEHIFSDQAQLDFLGAYYRPARFAALDAAGKIPAALASKLPAASQYQNITFVTGPQERAAVAQVLQLWMPLVRHQS